MKLPERLSTGSSSARPTNPFRGIKTRLGPSSRSPPIPPARLNAPGPSASRALPPSEITESEDHTAAEMLQVEVDENEATQRLIMSLMDDEVRNSLAIRVACLLLNRVRKDTSSG
jgi:hypothetical protein